MVTIEKFVNITYSCLYARPVKVVIKLPVFGTNVLKSKFWKSLSNSQATFNLENVNFPSNPNVNSKNGVAYKKECRNRLVSKLMTS